MPEWPRGSAGSKERNFHSLARSVLCLCSAGYSIWLCTAPETLRMSVGEIIKCFFNLPAITKWCVCQSYQPSISDEAGIVVKV